MKILILTCEGHVAGSTNSIAFLARGLAARGHTVYVGCREQSLLFSMLEPDPVKRVPMRFAGRCDMQTMRRIRDLVRQEGVQLINAQSSRDRYAAILARWIFRLRAVVVHTRRQRPLSMGGWLQNTFYVRGTDRIIVISEELKRTFVRHGIPEGHLQVIHNGMPAGRYRQVDEAQVEVVRTELGINQGDRVIGSISRLKNQDQLVKALPRIDPEVKALFVGVERGCFDALAHSLGVAERIIYGGVMPPERALACYRLCAVSVLASTMDGFGLVLLEAMGQGVPVVATRAGGIIDVVRNNENGLLFEDGDIDGLAACLQRVLQDQVLRTRLIANGYRSALEEFTIEKTVSGYETFFRELIEKRLGVQDAVAVSAG